MTPPHGEEPARPDAERARRVVFRCSAENLRACSGPLATSAYPNSRGAPDGPVQHGLAGVLLEGRRRDDGAGDGPRFCGDARDGAMAPEERRLRLGWRRRDGPAHPQHAFDLGDAPVSASARRRSSSLTPAAAVTAAAAAAASASARRGEGRHYRSGRPAGGRIYGTPARRRGGRGPRRRPAPKEPSAPTRAFQILSLAPTSLACVVQPRASRQSAWSPSVNPFFARKAWSAARSQASKRPRDRGRSIEFEYS